MQRECRRIIELRWLYSKNLCLVTVQWNLHANAEWAEQEGWLAVFQAQNFHTGCEISVFIVWILKIFFKANSHFIIPIGDKTKGSIWFCDNRLVGKSQLHGLFSNNGLCQRDEARSGCIQEILHLLSSPQMNWGAPRAAKIRLIVIYSRAL